MVEEHKIGDECCTEADRNNILETLKQNNDAISRDKSDMGFTDIVEHSIELNDEKPVFVPLRRVPMAFKGPLREILKMLQDNDVIERARSPFNAPVVCVKKKDGSMRLCIDYRKLKLNTVKDSHPLPRTDVLLESLNGSKFFSTIDFTGGYYQVKMRSSDKHKTAFSTENDQYQFLRLPMGLCNSPATFTRMMKAVLSDLIGDNIQVYLDDVIVYTKDVEEHIEVLKKLFHRLREAGLKINTKKSNFLQTSIKFLGHIVSEEGIHTDPDKVDCIMKWPTPSSPKQVRQFLGLAGYYRDFIEHFAKLAAPLSSLQAVDKRIFKWTEKHESSFNAIKNAFRTLPVLKFPVDDEPFLLDLDASNTAIGGVLQQKYNDKWYPIRFGSRILSKTEVNYSTTKRELLAIVYFVTVKFRYYLLGRHFKLRTDHSSLKYLNNFQSNDKTIIRWLERLASFDFLIEYRKGKLHTNADALSRIPIEQVNVVQQPWNTNVDLIKAQKTDENLKFVFEWVENKKRIQAKYIGQYPDYARTLWRKFSNLVLISGLLNIKRDGKLKMLIPRSCIEDILKQCHDDNGHHGFQKTYRKLQEHYYWPTMRMDAKEWTSSCASCNQRNAPVPTVTAPLQAICTDKPNGMLCIDVMKLTKSEKGNLMICRFSKMMKAVPISSERSDTIIEILKTYWFSYFGAPDCIHSDKGTNFRSRKFHEMCTAYGIQKSETTPFHPQGNGVCERVNRTILKMLSHYVNEKQDDWDIHVPDVLFSYNNTRHEATNLSPNCVWFGRNFIPRGKIRNPDIENVCNPDEIDQRKEENTEIAYRNLVKSAGRMTKQYNKRKKTKVRPFKIGDYVLVYNPSLGKGKTTKLNRPYKGPYIIRQQMSNETYEIEKILDTIPGKAVQIVHVNRIKPVKIRFEPEVTENETSSDEEVSCEESVMGEENSNSNSSTDEDHVGNSDASSNEDVTEPDSQISRKRTRKPPAHLRDFLTF